MQLILYLGGEQADLYRAARRQVGRIAQFATDADGQAAFAEFMAGQPATPCRILADLIEEEFRQEALPHVGGSDKKALHARHAARLFRSTPFRHTRVLGREAGGRRDDKVLLSALTNHELVEPWTRILEKAGQPLFGIHSLPIVSRHIVAALSAARGNALLITLQRGNRLRETFLQNNQVCFSRLAPLSDTENAGFGFTVKAEIEKTRRYLTTLKLLGFEERFAVHVVCDGAHLMATRALGGYGDYCDTHAHGLRELAARFGIVDYPDGSYSDLLYVALLNKVRVLNHYAQHDHRRLARLHRVRSAVNRVSLGVVAGAALWSGINIVDSLALEAKRQALNANSAQTRLAMEQIDRLQQRVMADPRDVQAAVEIADRLKAQSAQPRAFLTQLGSVLRRSPDIALDNLAWSVGSADDARDAQDGAPRTTVTLEGHIRAFDGSYLHADQQVARLSTMLGDLPGVQRSEVLKHPANAAPDASLNGSVNAEQDGERASFTLQFVFGEAHG